MYCKYCGKEVDENAVVCPYCGVQIGELNKSSKSEYSVLAIVGFVLSFLISIAGLVCSIIGYKQCVNENKNGKALALAGIIISAISMGIYIIGFISIIVAGGCMVSRYPTFY